LPGILHKREIPFLGSLEGRAPRDRLRRIATDGSLDVRGKQRERHGHGESFPGGGEWNWLDDGGGTPTPPQAGRFVPESPPVRQDGPDREIRFLLQIRPKIPKFDDLTQANRGLVVA
jgi:hypothetical protein